MQDVFTHFEVLCLVSVRHLVRVTTTTVCLHPFVPFSVQPGRPSHWSCLALSSSCEPQDNTVCMRVFSRHDTAHPCERFSLCSGVLSWWKQVCLLLLPVPTPFISSPMQQGKGFGKKTMDLTIKGWNGVKDTVELGEDDTPAVMRRKVASAVGLPDDGFVMSFGGVAMDEGYDMTQLSAGDTIVLSITKKHEARAALHALGETDITAERLETVEDPEVACLLLQAEVATVIPDFFLRNTSLTSLDLSAESVVTQIGHSFLQNRTSLTSIDLSGLIHVTHIGACFLFGCSSLCSLDLTPLSRVTRVGFNFLYGCSSLCTLDLTPFSSVTQVAACFLYGCSSLRTLDLSPLSSVTEINPFCFLGECTSLESIYLTGCSDVVSSTVRNSSKLHLVVESRPKRSRDEPLEESRKRLRHAE